MSRTPEFAGSLPVPASEDASQPDNRVLRWPLSPPQARAPSPILTAVNAYIESQGGGEGLFPTPIEGFNIVRLCQAILPMRGIYRPSLCVVLQGAKELRIGEDVLEYGIMECLVVTMELPARGQVVQASQTTPYIGVTLEFDVAMMREVIEQMDAPGAVPASDLGPGLFVGKVDESLAGCFERIVRMLGQPKSIPILYPVVMREIYYWLLSSPNGHQLRKLALPGSNIERIVKAIALLHTRFAQTLSGEQLAEAAQMSTSSFHQHFKALTKMTPLQFQKQLRLLEARRLMVSEAAKVADAAYKVGYESPSQFSREYTRTFGMAPKQDVMMQQSLHTKYLGRAVRSA
ncbi:AraC family transcriptional regulator [Terrihabitans rhizophilus]|uniref:AraC family transcriptional regulator n=1 Tax=Terrihabitans rhizophilus TaxID=3092662 RepID=A0ABU4RJ52_9HYPH|nr:AraC family transcriptional regulator [Terrihabitans sp. PJ23]MDX6804878.1 AraC family transcriptional regulator [Terrihabitans sp. PJ23]